VAAIGLALTFTLSCSSGSDDNGGGTSSPSGGGDLSSSSVGGGGGGSSSSVGGGLTGTSGTITDSRDNKSYKWVKIGEQYWLAENMNYDVEGSICYGEAPTVLGDPLSTAEIQANCNKYGRLYTWATAMGIETKYNSELWNGQTWDGSPVPHQGICPASWHIPDGNEWSILINSVTDECYEAPCPPSIAGTVLKANSGWEDTDNNPSGNGTGDYGFNALPGGDCNLTSSDNGGGGSIGCSLAGQYGEWWSASQSKATSATRYYMAYFYTDVKSSSQNKNFLKSVRCIKD